jgi:hypothetical protein
MLNESVHVFGNPDKAARKAELAQMRSNKRLKELERHLNYSELARLQQHYPKSPLGTPRPKLRVLKPANSTSRSLSGHRKCLPLLKERQLGSPPNKEGFSSLISQCVNFSNFYSRHPKYDDHTIDNTLQRSALHTPRASLKRRVMGSKGGIGVQQVCEQSYKHPVTRHKLRRTEDENFRPERLH